MEVIAPPESLRAGMGPFADAALFLQSGRDTLELAKRTISLSPSVTILDVGCGCGRVALPLTAYLGGDGGYAGFDADAACIEWCTENIAAHDHRFTFTHLDVQSGSYNRDGGIAPHAAVFPYAEAAFDRALVSSVFTHMCESGIVRYVHELYRVLRADGQALISVFLMNAAARLPINGDRTLFRFEHVLGEHSWALDAAQPTEAVAVEQEWFLNALASHGFEVMGVQCGDWRDRSSWQIQHDWVAVRRPVVDGAA